MQRNRTSVDEEGIKRLSLSEDGRGRGERDEVSRCSEPAPLTMERVRKFSAFRSMSTESPRGTIPCEAIEAQRRNGSMVFDDDTYKKLPEARSRRSEEIFDAFSCGKPILRSANVVRQPTVVCRRKVDVGTVEISDFKATVLVDAKSAPIEIAPVVPPLPRPPYELERCASFYANIDLKKLIDTLTMRLTHSGADFDFNSQKYKWKVLAYDEGDENQTCDVVVRMFRVRTSSSSKKTTYAVEFQRRRGCAFAYHRWLTPVVNGMIAKGIVLDVNGKRRTEEMHKPFCPHMTKVQEDEDVPTLTAYDVKPLTEMAKANCASVRSESMRELAKLSRNVKNHPHIAETKNGLLESVKCAFQDADAHPGVSRCAASLVNVLSKCSRTVRGPLSEIDMFSTLRLYLSGTTDRVVGQRRTQREAIDALVNIVSQMKSGDERREEGIKIIRHIQNSTLCSSVQEACKCALHRVSVRA